MTKAKKEPRKEFDVVAQTLMIPVSLLDENKGQIEGVPKNPRVIKGKCFKQLCESIKEDPELLNLRPLLVYPRGDRYVVIDGNMRVKALRDMAHVMAPCEVLQEGTTPEQMKRYIAKTNSAFGDWDWDALANEWDCDPLDDWGIDLPEGWGDEESEEANDEDGNGGDTDRNVEKIPEVEAMLNEAMRENAREFVEQLDYDMAHGWLPGGITKGYVQAQFIKAKFYGGAYNAVNNLYFQPLRFLCPSGLKNGSVRNAFEGVADGKNSGLAGLRTATNDGKLSYFYSSNYPVAQTTASADFPPMLAKQLLEEFTPPDKKTDVLDPCHGWGGRIVGALLADVSSYTGIDPSDDAHDGVIRIIDAFGKYSKHTKIEIRKECFEDTNIEKESYDIALTSPPYFNVEKYAGENQSHIKYPQYDLWKEKFYTPLIAKTYYALRPGGVFVLNVGSQTYPLKKDGIIIAESCGFVVEEIRPFGRGTNSGLRKKNGSDDSENNEKIIILRK